MFGLFESADQRMQKQLFNLKLTAKQLNRMSTKANKEHDASKLKVKKCMEKGDQEGARIHAQTAIRNKTSANNYLRTSARLDACASRVESAIKAKQVTKQMGDVTKSMDKVLATMDIGQISTAMDKFEKQMEDLDVVGGAVDQAMGGATAGMMPESEVEQMMRMVADEHNLEITGALGTASNASVGNEQASTSNEMEGRLAALRST